MAKKLKFGKKKLKEIHDFLEVRFKQLDDLRSPFDTQIIEEVELSNDIDKNMKPWDKETKEGKHWYEQKVTIPYIYTIIQTMVARIIQTFFGKQNYLKIYTEVDAYKPVEKTLQLWVQYELDRIDFKERARDFIEDALVQRTTWLELRPVLDGKKNMTKVDFNVYQWFDIWYDTKAVKVEDTDFFVRMIVPLWKLQEQDKLYMNLDQIKNTVPTDDDIKQRQVYKAKHDREEKILYYDPIRNNVTDEVVVYRYLGWYDVSKEKDEKPIYKPVIYHWANRAVLILVEEIDLETERKILLFPIRPIRQANSLVGKSVPQLTKHLQYLLNEVVSQTVQNFKTITGLMFKYNKNAGIDLSELFAGDGNAIGWEDDPNDISLFEVKNVVEIGMAMISWIIQFMQQVTGAVDYLMGTSAARGSTETASGIKTITEQAMFKFQMMAENIYGDLKKFVNYLIILWDKYNSELVLEKFPELEEFFNMDEKMLEESQAIDIGMNDLTLRRDAERTAFLNGINMIGGMLEKIQGNMPALLREVMKKLDMEHIDEIMKGSKTPKEIMEMVTQQTLAAQANQKKGGSNKMNPQAENAATPEEEQSNTTPKAAETS